MPMNWRQNMRMKPVTAATAEANGRTASGPMYIADFLVTCLADNRCDARYIGMGLIDTCNASHSNLLIPPFEFMTKREEHRGKNIDRVSFVSKLRTRNGVTLDNLFRANWHS